VPYLFGVESVTVQPQDRHKAATRFDQWFEFGLAVPDMRLLVVEDDPTVADLLVTILRDDGYEVRAVDDGVAALAEAATFRPDLVLLDAGLPRMDGWSVARRLRQSGDVPIILVTGADSREDVRAGFGIGVDDYVVKPFDGEELSARVRAVLRRSGQAVPRHWELGDLDVDGGARSVTRAGFPVALTATEYELLVVLLRNRQRVVPKGQLLSEVWHYDSGERDDHLVEVHVSALRRKLEAHGPRLVHTVRGAGYILHE
jgi:two-component system OmpR family response regulator